MNKNASPITLPPEPGAEYLKFNLAGTGRYVFALSIGEAADKCRLRVLHNNLQEAAVCLDERGREVWLMRVQR